MAQTQVPDDCHYCHQPIGPRVNCVYVCRVKTADREGYVFDDKGPHSGMPVKEGHVRIIHMGRMKKSLLHEACWEKVCKEGKL